VRVCVCAMRLLHLLFSQQQRLHRHTQRTAEREERCSIPRTSASYQKMIDVVFVVALYLVICFFCCCVLPLKTQDHKLSLKDPPIP
jgi:hypothetical protein